MTQPSNSTKVYSFRRWWRILTFTVRFFTPRICQVVFSCARYLALPLAVYWALEAAEHRMSSWSPLSSTWLDAGAKAITVSVAAASTLTLFAIFLDVVCMTRTAIALVSLSFFTFFCSWLLVSHDRAPGEWAPFVPLVCFMVFQEIFARVRPWTYDTWNGKSVVERWSKPWLGFR